MSKKQLEKFIEIKTDIVRDNVVIVSTKDLEQDYMLHVSPVRMSNKEYIPRIGSRQDPREDRTIPRITVAPTLYGCLIGYINFLKDALNYEPNNKENKQGLYIHEIEFEHCLKPSNKMVPDSRNSDEHWLVTYNEDTVEYKGKLIGKMFITDINYKMFHENYPDITITMHIHITKEEGIRFSKNIFLTKGYWKLISKLKGTQKEFWDKDNLIIAEEVTEKEYLNAKQISADMLSIKDELPKSAEW